MTTSENSTVTEHVNERILVVDDDARLRSLLQRFFGR